MACLSCRFAVLYISSISSAVGLPLAIKAHSEGNLDLAHRNYKRALEQNDTTPILFQNYGALRANGDTRVHSLFT